MCRISEKRAADVDGPAGLADVPGSSQLFSQHSATNSFALLFALATLHRYRDLADRCILLSESPLQSEGAVLNGRNSAPPAAPLVEEIDETATVERTFAAPSLAGGLTPADQLGRTQSGRRHSELPHTRLSLLLARRSRELGLVKVDCLERCCGLSTYQIASGKRGNRREWPRSLALLRRVAPVLATTTCIAPHGRRMPCSTTMTTTTTLIRPFRPSTPRRPDRQRRER